MGHIQPRALGRLSLQQQWVRWLQGEQDLCCTALTYVPAAEGHIPWGHRDLNSASRPNPLLAVSPTSSSLVGWMEWHWDICVTLLSYSNYNTSFGKETYCWHIAIWAKDNKPRCRSILSQGGASGQHGLGTPISVASSMQGTGVDSFTSKCLWFPEFKGPGKLIQLGWPKATSGVSPGLLGIWPLIHLHAFKNSTWYLSASLGSQIYLKIQPLTS